MEKKNAYIDSVLAALKEKQALAMQEFEKTDLNSIEEYVKIKDWFITVTSMVKKNPPQCLVKRLNIYENNVGTVIRVTYDYYTGNVCDAYMVEMRVFSDLY